VSPFKTRADRSGASGSEDTSDPFSEVDGRAAWGLPPDDIGPWSRTKRRWYKRGSVLALAAVVVIGGVSALVDVPQKDTVSQQAAAMSASVKAVNTGVHPCTFAISQAFSFLSDIRGDTISSSERSQIPGLMKTDVQACSFVDQSEVTLSTITVPNTKAGAHLGFLIKDVYLWSTSDAVAAMDDINSLITDPHDVAAEKTLTKQEGLLEKDRSAAVRQVDAMARSLDNARLPALQLPNLPAPAKAP